MPFFVLLFLEANETAFLRSWFWTKGKQGSSQCHLCKQGPSGKKICISRALCWCIALATANKTVWLFPSSFCWRDKRGIFLLFVFIKSFRNDPGKKTEVNVGGKCYPRVGRIETELMQQMNCQANREDSVDFPPCPLSQASTHQSPSAVPVSLLWQWLIGVLMKPSLQSPDQSHLISCSVYRSVLARRHSLEHSSGVHRQVFQRYEWIVFVSANWGLIFTWPRLVFFEGVYLGLPHVELVLKCDT